MPFSVYFYFVLIQAVYYFPKLLFSFFILCSNRHRFLFCCLSRIYSVLFGNQHSCDRIFKLQVFVCNLICLFERIAFQILEIFLNQVKFIANRHIIANIFGNIRNGLRAFRKTCFKFFLCLRLFSGMQRQSHFHKTCAVF